MVIQIFISDVTFYQLYVLMFFFRDGKGCFFFFFLNSSCLKKKKKDSEYVLVLILKNKQKDLILNCQHDSDCPILFCYCYRYTLLNKAEKVCHCRYDLLQCRKSVILALSLLLFLLFDLIHMFGLTLSILYYYHNIVPTYPLISEYSINQILQLEHFVCFYN